MQIYKDIFKIILKTFFTKPINTLFSQKDGDSEILSKTMVSASVALTPDKY